MQINTLYDRDQKVYVIRLIQTPSFIPCTMCEGEGVLLTMSQNKRVCRFCNGEKRITNGGSLTYKVRLGLIKRINIESSEFATQIQYMIEDLSDNESTRLFNQSEVFGDISNADIACEDMNKRGMMGYKSLTDIT